MTGAMRGNLRKAQILSGNAIKRIAAAAMFIDHFSKIVLSYLVGALWYPMQLAGTLSVDQYTKINDFIHGTLYGVGSLAFPLFCFLVAEGYHYTHNRSAYIGRMLLFALLSELPFDIGFFSSLSARQGTFPFYWAYQNVFFSYTLSLLCLCAFDYIQAHCRQKGLSLFLLALCTAITAGLAELMKCDYGALGVAYIAAFYLLRKHRLCQLFALCLLYMIGTGSQPTLFVFLAALLLLLYNGSRGRCRSKYVFYWFYPAHIALLYLLTCLLGFIL